MSLQSALKRKEFYSGLRLNLVPSIEFIYFKLKIKALLKTYYVSEIQLVCGQVSFSSFHLFLFLSPLFPSFNPPSPSPHPSFSPFLLREESASHGCQLQHMELQWD